MSVLDHLYGRRVLNFAHRGASGHAPQNTLAAFLLAAEMGADGIELDVHLSADGEIVVIHNDSVDATTDSHGRVSQMKLSELRALDAGEWFGPRFSGERIPTLQQVFDAVGHRLLINVEIKVERDHHPVEQESKVVRLIEQNDVVHQVIISSFSPRSLRRVREMDPNISLGLLYDRQPPGLFSEVSPWPDVSYDTLHPSFRSVDSESVEKARGRGKRVNVWTVNSADDMRRMYDLGVDGIITNYPDVLQTVLEKV